MQEEPRHSQGDTFFGTMKPGLIQAIHPGPVPYQQQDSESTIAVILGVSVVTTSP